MRTRYIRLVSAVVFAGAMAMNGCKDSSSGSGAGGTGGSSGSGGGTHNGGSSSGGSIGNGGSLGSGGGAGTNQPADAATCSNVEPCGGDVVGIWTVTSSCLSVTGALDLSLVGAGCPSGPVTGSLQVTGTWTANTNGTYSDGTTTSGDEQLTLAASCLVISSTQTNCAGAASLLPSGLGFSELNCPSATGGGCNCTGAVKQTGTLGFPSPAPTTSGNYTTSGNVITITGDSGDTQYAYCVSGNKMTMTPKSTNPTMTGAIVLQRSGSAGSGGAPGSGGQVGSGGKSSSGGANGSGGTTGSGGQVGSGGKSSSGGATGSGGAGGATGQAGSGGTLGSGGTTGSGGTSGSGGGSGPCDIYAAATTPCVAAHSVVRALYGAYNGKLYQVRRTDNTTKDILTLAPGGIADTAPEDTFCAGSTCVLTVVYDQSGKGNDLWYQGSTQVPASPSSSPAKATADSVTVAGHKVYSVYISPGNCYWHDGSASGMPTGAQPEGMYMVTSSRHANGGCCFDYGNSETDRSADGSGAMDSLNFSTTTAWGSGAGSGPWVMADLEYGLFAQGNTSKNSSDPTQTAPFVTAVLKNNGTTEYALKGGDATSGSLSTYYKGALPGGWSPMKKQGALILGCGGDCCKPSGGANASSGIFFEGAIVTGYPTDAAETAIQANIVAAGYGK